MAGIPGIEFVHFDETDVVRHPLVQRIILAYDRTRGAPSRRADAPERSRSQADERGRAQSDEAPRRTAARLRTSQADAAS